MLKNAYLLIASSLIGISTLFAQQDSIAIKYAATITEADLSKHLHIIASDEYGGRETGKESLKLVVEIYGSWKFQFALIAHL